MDPASPAAAAAAPPPPRWSLHRNEPACVVGEQRHDGEATRGLPSSCFDCAAAAACFVGVVIITAGASGELVTESFPVGEAWRMCRNFPDGDFFCTEIFFIVIGLFSCSSIAAGATIFDKKNKLFQDK
ncbi:uncharacterized protein [Oryza sativa Japonica Group]|uniref:uncharacterized protein isoform X2 n=1 Tax=Oryza sativa subsp. japonica TaxID=39947 RepID=UPI00077555B8|nr:uncharacterized protein LOC107281452 isoform X2 [Oryza sativa Japonica Group]